MALITVRRKIEFFVEHKTEHEEHGPYFEFGEALDKFIELNSEEYAIHIYLGGKVEGTLQ